MKTTFIVSVETNNDATVENIHNLVNDALVQYGEPAAEQYHLEWMEVTDVALCDDVS